MAKKMEEMSTELSRLRIEKQRWNGPRDGGNRNQNYDGGNRNPNHYFRNNVPRIMQREKREDDDQKVQPPFQNFLNEDEEIEGNDEHTENNLFDDELDIRFLTEEEYEYAFMAQNEVEEQRYVINQQVYNLRNRQVPKPSVPQKDFSSRNVPQKIPDNRAIPQKVPDSRVTVQRDQDQNQRGVVQKNGSRYEITYL